MTVAREKIMIPCRHLWHSQEGLTFVDVLRDFFFSSLVSVTTGVPTNQKSGGVEGELKGETIKYRNLSFF